RSPAANAAGWNNRDVTVKYACADDRSGVASCPDEQTLSTDGKDQSASGSVRDAAGNQATAAVTGVNIHTAKPVVTITGGGTYDAVGPRCGRRLRAQRQARVGGSLAGQGQRERGKRPDRRLPQPAGRPERQGHQRRARDAAEPGRRQAVDAAAGAGARLRLPC